MSTTRHSVSVMLDERVLARLAASTRFSDIRWLEVTDSTNRVVAELAESGSPEGVVVATELQTAGRGRLDRTWEARPGTSLLVSVLLRPASLEPDRWHLVTAAAGLAARRACSEVAAFTPELKWPNDLMVEDRKLAGILAQAAGGAVVVGMGLNVREAPPGAAFADEAAGATVDRAGLLEAWLVGLDGLLGRWDEVAALYGATCATVGRRVVVQREGPDLVGTAEAIDAGGRLVVRPDHGPAIAVSAGDVVHVRPG
ncbi:MAG: biotin--[acetyl-CoA-carboxylase] ligase [Acidimicrobiales bacterium]